MAGTRSERDALVQILENALKKRYCGECNDSIDLGAISRLIDLLRLRLYESACLIVLLAQRTLKPTSGDLPG
jgi:hypothetical protein